MSSSFFFKKSLWFLFHRGIYDLQKIPICGGEPGLAAAKCRRRVKTLLYYAEGSQNSFLHLATENHNSSQHF
jgi:hypothetical protein